MEESTGTDHERRSGAETPLEQEGPANKLGEDHSEEEEGCFDHELAYVMMDQYCLQQRNTSTISLARRKAIQEKRSEL